MSEIPKSLTQEIPDPDADILADLDALAGEVMGSAQARLDKRSELVSPAPEKKSERRSRGARKESGDRSDGERIRMPWIKETGQAIAEAKDLEQLMPLVELVENGTRKTKLALSLPKGLPKLLTSDKTFGKEFDALFATWSNRVTEILFNEDGISHFQNFLRDVVVGSPRIPKERFFDMYLKQFDLSVLKHAPLVIAKMRELWEQYSPVVNQELKEKNNPPEEIIVGGGYVLKNDPSREYTVIEISGDGEIVYKPLAGGSINRSTREKFLQYLRAKDRRPVSIAPESVSSEEKERGRQVEIELSQEMELWMQDIQKIKTREVFDELTKRAARNGRYTKAPGFVVGRFFTELLKKQSITSDQEKRRLKSLAYKLQEQIEPVYLAKQSEMYPPKTAISRKTESVAGVPVPASAVEAVKITPENLAKSSERTYEDFFREADDKGYHDILFGAAAAGIRTMKEGAQKESVDLREYDKGHPGEILEALIDGMKDSLARVGKELGWSESEIDIYARGLVQKSIEKYLK